MIPPARHILGPARLVAGYWETFSRNSGSTNIRPLPIRHTGPSAGTREAGACSAPVVVRPEFRLLIPDS
jgi:hypothetical protein